MEQLWFEAVKLAVQLIGAIIVARIAVKWALDRYKLEKMWERRLAAYVELIISLSEMRIVLALILDETDGELPPDPIANHRERYHSARRRLDEASGQALLVLSRNAADSIATIGFEIELQKRYGSGRSSLDCEHELLGDKMAEIIKMGRDDLGLTAPPNRARFKFPLRRSRRRPKSN